MQKETVTETKNNNYDFTRFGDFSKELDSKKYFLEASF